MPQSGIRWPRWSSSAAPGAHPGCWPPWPPPGSRNTRGPRAPGIGGEPLADLLGVTGSASRWTVELLTGLRVDADRMRANLDAAGGFPMAARVAAMLTTALGRSRRTKRWPGERGGRDRGPAASRRAARRIRASPVAPGADPDQQQLDAILSPEQLDAALDPAGYLGAARRRADALAGTAAQGAGQSGGR